jgi:hypothetical protein
MHVALLLLINVLVASALSCTGRNDCSYNGECIAGACKCEPAWRGDFCESLYTLPGLDTLGYRGSEGGKRLSSWGGAPLLGDDGQYHLIASEMENHAGLLPWGCNSRVIHAVSRDPLREAFKKKRVLWPVFSHEPRCTRAPRTATGGGGEFVCYFSHNPAYPSAPCRGTDGNTGPECQCDNGGDKPTYMSFASDVNGNWSAPVLVLDSQVDLNLSPFIHSNGSLHALYRDNTGSNIHIATAADWRDPASYMRHPGDLSNGVRVTHALRHPLAPLSHTRRTRNHRPRLR